MKVMSWSEARDQGFKRYFTGKPCSKGHIAERYAGGTGGGGNCVVCDQIRSKELYLLSHPRKQHICERLDCTQMVFGRCKYCSKECASAVKNDARRARGPSSAKRDADRRRYQEMSDTDKALYREYQKAWKAENADQYNAVRAAWKKRNADKVRDEKKRWKRRQHQKYKAAFLAIQTLIQQGILV